MYRPRRTSTVVLRVAAKASLGWYLVWEPRARRHPAPAGAGREGVFQLSAVVLKRYGQPPDSRAAEGP